MRSLGRERRKPYSERCALVGMPMSYGALARREPPAHDPEDGGGTH